MNMYGRQGYNSSYNNSYSSNNNSSSYNNSYSSYNRNNEEKLGSYRGEYKYEEPPSYLTSIISNWKSYPPLSITTREEFLHLTPTEVRVEDYYLMRNKKLRSTHQERMRDAIRKEAYNEELNRTNCYSLLPYSSERPFTLDSVKAMAKTSDTPSYNSNSNLYNSRNSNIFSGNSNNGGYNNNSNNNNNSSSNIFNRNSNTNTSNTYNNSSNSNNIFSGNNNNSSNVFNRNSNTTGNSYNNNYNNNSGGNNSSNIFNRGSNNTGSNMFSNNNSNGGNIFNNGGNNSQGNNVFNNNNNSNGNNIFSNNNNGGNNIFNNNNSGGSRNIFNGNNNNSNNSFSNNNNNRNIFSNGGNNGNGNIFNNSNNSNPYNNQGDNMLAMGLDPRFFTQLHTYMKSMNEIVKKMNGFTEDQKSSSPATNSTSNSLFPTYDNSCLDLYEHELRSRKKKQEESTDFVIMIPQSTNKPASNRFSQEQEDERMNNCQEQYNGSMRNTRTINTYSQVRPESRRNPEISMTQHYNNTKSRLMTNTYKPKSATKQERVDDIKEQEECDCVVKISILWSDGKQFKGHRLRSEIESTVRMTGFKPKNEAWKEQLIQELKNPIIRRDATLKINDFLISRNGNGPQVEISGVLTQQIVNNKDGMCNWQRFENDKLHGLTLQNQFGKVEWQDPVKIQCLDFTYFSIHQNQIQAEPDTPLNCRCMVEFFSVPKEIQKEMGQSYERAKERLKRSIEKQGQGKFRLMCLQMNSWKMQVQCFP